MRHISNTFFIKQYLGYQKNYEAANIERCINHLNVEPFDFLGKECKHSIKIERGKLYLMYRWDDGYYTHLIEIDNNSCGWKTIILLRYKITHAF